MEESDRANLFDIYMYAWQQGLKSTYYCFIEKNIQGEKYTESVNKRGTRTGFGSAGGAVADVSTAAISAGVARAGFGARKQTEEVETSTTADTTDVAETDAATQTHESRIDLSHIDVKNVTAEQRSLIEMKLRAEKGDEYVEKLKKGELYEAGACPIDPFEKVMCDGCQ